MNIVKFLSISSVFFKSSQILMFKVSEKTWEKLTHMKAERVFLTNYFYLQQRIRYIFLSVFVCLSVSKITQKRVHGFGWNVLCRQMSGHGRTDYLLSPIRIIVQMLEPDWFLWYYIDYGTLQPCQGCQQAVLLCGILRREYPTYSYWWHAARASRSFKMVLFTEPFGRPLSEVNALNWVPY